VRTQQVLTCAVKQEGSATSSMRSRQFSNVLATSYVCCKQGALPAHVKVDAIPTELRRRHVRRFFDSRRRGVTSQAPPPPPSMTLHQCCALPMTLH
jgi:hypothetical protein